MLDASSSVRNSAARFFKSAPYLVSRRSMKSFSCRRIISILTSNSGWSNSPSLVSIACTEPRRAPFQPGILVEAEPALGVCNGSKVSGVFFEAVADSVNLLREIGEAGLIAPLSQRGDVATDL